MPALPTVRIVNPKKDGDYLIINESDFDPAVHRLFGTTGAASAGEQPVKQAHVSAGVAPRGKRGKRSVK